MLVIRAQQDLGQQDAQLETAREGRKRRAVHGHGNAQPHQDFASARLEGVAIVRRDEVFKIADPARIGMAFVGNALLFAQGLPYDGVAPHGQMQNHRVVVENDCGDQCAQ